MEINSSINNSQDFSAVKSAVMTLRAVNHKQRQHILALIENRKYISVTEIYVKLHLDQSIASQHLAILRRAKVVSTRRDGKTIYYSLNHTHLTKIAVFANSMGNGEERSIKTI